MTGASVTEYTQNASQGMSMHFNIWVGNARFGGILDPSTLPVHEYISWAQYSSYANGAFQLQWREEFDGSTIPSLGRRELGVAVQPLDAQSGQRELRRTGSPCSR